MTKDFRVQIKIKNNRLLEKMEEAGYKSNIEFSRAVGVDAVNIGEFINMKRAPINKFTGEYLPKFMKIVDFLKCLPEDIFPKRLMNKELKGYVAELKVNSEDLTTSLRSIAIEPDKKMIIEEANRNLNRFIEQNTTPRQQRVLELRFGLHGNEEHTLQEIGEQLGISKDRVRQIEAAALVRLKRYQKRKELMGIIDGLNIEN
jgi:RNA polymerase sigma factor (sigma-70 family)